MKTTSTYNVGGLIGIVILAAVGSISSAWANGVTTPKGLILAGITGISVAVVGFLINKKKGGGAVDLSRIPVPIQDLLIAVGDEIKRARVEEKERQRQAVKEAEATRKANAERVAALRDELARLEGETPT